MGFIAAYAYFGFRWYSTGVPSPFPIPVAAADASVNEQPVTEAQVEAHTVPEFQPRYVSILKTGLTNARVMKVGVTENKMLALPSNLNDVGWFEKSATPGSGSAAVVLTGHNGGISRVGALAKLHDLEAGDEIAIERGDGKQFVYLVRKVRNVTLEQFNAGLMKDMMQSLDPEQEGLSIITSAGNWIPKQKVFDRRILVQAAIAK